MALKGRLDQGYVLSQWAGLGWVRDLWRLYILLFSETEKLFGFFFPGSVHKETQPSFETDCLKCGLLGPFRTQVTFALKVGEGKKKPWYVNLNESTCPKCIWWSCIVHYNTNELNTQPYTQTERGRETEYASLTWECPKVVQFNNSNSVKHWPWRHVRVMKWEADTVHVWGH